MALDWYGGFEPFGRDWQEGTSMDSFTKGIFLRLPGQWNDPLWTNPMLGADHDYNVHRWYEWQSGRYGSVDPVAWITRDSVLYLYSQSSPTRLFDPFGLVTVQCEGCSEIRDFLERTRPILENLRTRGTAKPEPASGDDTRTLATTGCADFEGGTPFTIWEGPYPFAKNPCIHSCIGVHERVHRNQCRLLGPERWKNLSEKEAEIPAYEAGIKCLESALRNGSLEIDLDGVSY